MSVASDFAEADTAVQIGLLVAVVVVGYIAYEYLTNNVAPPAGSDYANNDGTGYTAGPIGALGAGVNDLSGGALSSFGEWLGGLFAPSYDPNPPDTSNPGSAIVEGDD